MDIRQLRRAARMTQYELAAKTGISKVRLSFAECRYLELNADEITAIENVTISDLRDRLEGLSNARNGDRAGDHEVTEHANATSRSDPSFRKSEPPSFPVNQHSKVDPEPPITPADDPQFDFSGWALRTFQAYPTWMNHDVTMPPAELLEIYVEVVKREAPSRGGLLKTANWLLGIVEEYGREHRSDPHSVPYLGAWLSEGQYSTVVMRRRLEEAENA